MYVLDLYFINTGTKQVYYFIARQNGCHLNELTPKMAGRLFFFPEVFEDRLKFFRTDEFMAHNIDIHERLIVGKSGVFRNKFKFKKVTFRMIERDLIVLNNYNILAHLFYTDGCIGLNSKYALNVQRENITSLFLNV